MKGSKKSKKRKSPPETNSSNPSQAEKKRSLDRGILGTSEADRLYQQELNAAAGSQKGEEAAGSQKGEERVDSDEEGSQLDLRVVEGK